MKKTLFPTTPGIEALIEPSFRLPRARSSTSTVINSRAIEKSVVTIEQSNVEMITEGIPQGATTTRSQPVGISSSRTSSSKVNIPVHKDVRLSQAIEKANTTSTAMLVQESGTSRAETTIPMQVDVRLSQAIEKANSTSTAMLVHESGTSISSANTPKHVDVRLPQAME
jgi:hypothetical protein